MNITQITRDFSVSPQIKLADIHEIAKSGFKSIICNRPDFEEASQPKFSEIASAAADAGLQSVHVPVSAMPVTAQIAEMAEALVSLPKPIFAYCRTGNRSSALFHAVNN